MRDPRLPASQGNAWASSPHAETTFPVGPTACLKITPGAESFNVDRADHRTAAGPAARAGAPVRFGTLRAFDPYALSAWLRVGQIAADEIACERTITTASSTPWNGLRRLGATAPDHATWESTSPLRLPLQDVLVVDAHRPILQQRVAEVVTELVEASLADDCEAHLPPCGKH